MQFLHKKLVFQKSPQSCQSFGLILVEILLPRTFKNRLIRSHCLNVTAKTHRKELVVIHTHVAFRFGKLITHLIVVILFRVQCHNFNLSFP